jgi:hypothetical protein
MVLGTLRWRLALSLLRRMGVDGRIPKDSPFSRNPLAFADVDDSSDDGSNAEIRWCTKPRGEV